MSEVALISARKSSLTADAKRGSRTAKNVLSLTERPNKFLSTVQIGITLIGILTGLYSGDSIAYKLFRRLDSIQVLGYPRGMGTL